jgi:glycosyltransferase involved in cell wall biosynthesis
MQQPLNLLVFAYIYPPDAGSGVFRTLHFTNHWARGGDTVTLVTVSERDFLPDALLDPALCAQVENSIETVRTRAWRPVQALRRLGRRLRKRKHRAAAEAPAIALPAEASGRPLSPLKSLLSAVLAFPDRHCGWILPAVHGGLKVTRRRDIDCIYATGGPWSGLVAATLTHVFTGIPLVLDFRDPWYSNPNLRTRARMLRAMHGWLEARCVQRARLVVANTEALRQDFIQRYPRLDAGRFICITNGFETQPAVTAAPRQRFTMVHAGALYPPRDPLPLLEALANLIRRGDIAVDSLKIRLLDGMGADPARSEPLLAVLGGAIELLPRLPHAQALQVQREADVLLLFQTGFPLQAPRKLYEYLSLGLPILAVTERGGATAGILRDLEWGCATPNDAASIETAILELYRQWRQGARPRIDPARLRRYHNQALAGALRTAMATVAGRSA